jgi:hypothetical protein
LTLLLNVLLFTLVSAVSTDRVDEFRVERKTQEGWEKFQQQFEIKGLDPLSHEPFLTMDGVNAVHYGSSDNLEDAIANPPSGINPTFGRLIYAEGRRSVIQSIEGLDKMNRKEADRTVRIALDCCTTEHLLDLGMAIFKENQQIYNNQRVGFLMYRSKDADSEHSWGCVAVKLR